jgi:DNA-directed RNA polymerase specialized sigma24 family protein
MKSYNKLAIDMADLEPMEKWFLRLWAHEGLTSEDIGETFDMAGVDVRNTLRRSFRKYRRSANRLGIEY